MSLTPTYVPWYESEADFKAVLALLPAEESKNPLSYSEMLTAISQGEQKMQAQGFLPFRINIKAPAIKEWCEARNRKVNRAAIREYGILQIGSAILDKGKN